MNYQLTITKTESNTNFLEEMKQWKENNRYSSNMGNVIPQADIVKNVLTVELNEEQYKAIKAAVFKTFE